ncbi:glycosyltransferase [Simplicispira lacusdiani]|uniref:glycosyltransferase n=1 Tax=Simplicispira lacusdiani TaxID=2213010 RepID=UPI000E74A9DD|nr:glycosyltransferase [Simplicispira lacusdiani]
MNTVANKQPEVSVALLAWNHAHYIERCIKSALEQANDVRIEILVGDDASTDGTTEIVAAYARMHPELIQHIRRGERIGGSANYIDILARARAKFIAHLDGDDFWFPGKLRRQVSYMHENADCAAVYTNAVAISEQGDQIGVFNDFRDSIIGVPDLLRSGNFLCNSSMLFRSHLRTAIFAIKRPVLDFQIHLLHAATGHLAQIPEILVGYRVNSSGSIVAHANDFVRELYWQAIQSVPRELVSDSDYAHGIADFLRRVFFRAVRTRDLVLLRRWASAVYAASPYGRLRTTALVLGNITRSAVKMTAPKLAEFAGREHFPVLYRH